MKPVRLAIIVGLTFLVVGAGVRMMTGPSRDGKGTVFDTIQDEALKVKEAHEQESQAKKDSLAQPSPYGNKDAPLTESGIQRQPGT
ncbi:MAG: hypothetical protein HY737_03455 [Candidatus Omnitrophica bacterium]|nr:hypothetical protein [Candidatus Omnitrophota bacterium]